MRIRALCLTVALLPLLTGCSTLRATMDGWGQGRDGLSRPQRELRDALSGGDFPKVLAWSEDDALLRVLTSGATTYYAAQYARSAALLDTADLLTEQRLTESISKTGLSLLTNDMARPYQLRRTERLFVPWYAMLSYARLGQWEDAAVEARRMVALLARFAPEREDGERALHATMHYVAAAVFERAGEREAAIVAYRNAHALAAAYPEAPVAGSAAEGDVLVLVERGFVAHRATETIRIGVDDDDRDDLRGSDESRGRAIGRLGAIVRLASSPAGASFRQRDTTGGALPPVVDPKSRVEKARVYSDAHLRRGDDADDEEHHLSIVFPSLRRSPRPWAGLPRLSRDSGPDLVGAADLRTSASVDDASEVDERRERAGMISRELARAAAKYAVTRAVREKKGQVAGMIAEAGAALFERADVRSWHLLPQQVVVMRVRLPAGQHQLDVDVGEGANYRRVPLGPVDVRAGSVTIAPVRLWREP